MYFSNARKYCGRWRTALNCIFSLPLNISQNDSEGTMVEKKKMLFADIPAAFTK